MSIHSGLSRTQQRTYTALVYAGVEILLERGYDALNVTAITERANYGRGTFYLYFKDKEDFIWRIMRDQVERLDAHIAAEVAGLEYPDCEIKSWQIIFAQVEQQAPFWRRLNGETSHMLRQRQRILLIESFERNLRAGYFRLPVEMPPELGARFLVGAAQELLEYWIHHPSIGDARYMADLMCEVIYRRNSSASET